MYIPISKNGKMFLNKTRTVAVRRGSSLLLNEVKKAVNMGVVQGNGIVNYSNLVGIPRIRHQQLPESAYKRIKEEIPTKSGLLHNIKEMKESNNSSRMIQDLKGLKISGSRKKKGINNLRFEL